MKQIEGVAAIIRKGEKIFATQRGYGEWKDWWEFPGGKMEAGETPEEALKREDELDKAPEILGKDEQGRDIRLSDYKGRKLVLYFYPKDNTSGCTAEACSLRDHYSELQGRGYEVVGVSKDSAASHVKFKEKFQLPFPLIADINHELLEAMGAWGEKNMYGKKTMGTIRTTFIINEEGIIEKIFAGKQVKTKEHAEQILDNHETVL